MTAQLIVNGKFVYELNGGRVTEIAAPQAQEVRLNDDINTLPLSNYIIEFPTYNMKSLNYKQFQALVQNFAAAV